MTAALRPAHVSLRRVLIAVFAAVSIASALRENVHADTAVTGYGTPGNALNPTGLPFSLSRDPDGLSQLDDITRTPTGLLYPLPFLYPDLTQSKSDPDWWSLGWIETGVLGTFDRPRSAEFEKYADWSNGFIATNLGYYAENRKTALYVEGLAQNFGRSDQYYQLRVGRYGEFNVTAFFDSVPHLYSTEARSIWNGAGTGNLTLKDGLTAAGSTAAQISAVAAAVAPTSLQVTREKAGVSLSYTPYEEWQLFLQLSNEWRDGTQPISATFGYPFQNGATQIIQPIHYRTFDVSAALRYRDDDFQANLTYTGSFFHNRTSSLTWENPGLTSNTDPNAYIPLRGRLSLPPSNDYNSIKADATALLSPDVRFNGSVSYGLMEQNERLLAPTVDEGVIHGVGTTIDLSQWNTTAALSQVRAGAKVEAFNAFAQLQYTYSPDLTFLFELRDRNENNSTNYMAFNPLTGQYGYIAIDGGLAPFIPSLSGVYEPMIPGSLVQIRNMPFANDDLNESAKADYRLGTHSKLEISYTHDAVAHSIREVPDSDDHTGRIQFDLTGYEWGSVRLSYAFAKRQGSDYQSNPYMAYYTSALPGYIPLTPQGDPAFALSALRKFDVADRTEQTFHGQANYIVTPKADLQLTSDFKLDDYDASYGLRSTASYDVNVAFNYQMSLDTVFTGFASYQNQNRAAANINPTGQGTSGDPGSAGYPLANAWDETLNSNNYTVGLNARHRLRDVTLDLNYTFVHSNSAIRYSYASTGAFFDLLTAEQAGHAFPDITFDAHALKANALWQYSPRLTYRLFYQFAFEDIDDFHYNGLTSVISNNVYLGVRPESFSAHTVGLFVQYTL
ncbi:MAG: MtrB/PioB family outer membrane beta-barrel protein [Alphaproteobacteria bacterium]|nr:MtrB/PioB family outer membrane beta-barrel protein [Alphaproteobacteria bacterium]